MLTICPKCRHELRLQDVKFTAWFACPSCGEDLAVNAVYMRVLKTSCFALSWVWQFCLGPRNPLSLSISSIHNSALVSLGWFLAAFALSLFSYGFALGLWAYVGKYSIPPRLELVQQPTRGTLGI
jgi:hypothetical protein